MGTVLTELKPSKTRLAAGHKSVRTRFAPSPTGYLHIGAARTALFNYLFAKNHGGSFVLRIEDTDRERLVPDSLKNIKDSLLWLGINWDGEPVIQSERIEKYKNYAEELIAKDGAYYCFCSPERLDSLRKEQIFKKIPPMYDGLCKNLTRREVNNKISGGEKYVIRQKVPKTGVTRFNDLIKGNIEFENKLIDDSVLLKSDDYPTYHLANVVDDHLMNITHVIRAEEWLPSTPKHILMYEIFGWDMPKFAHLPMVLGTDKSKLSKRHGATSVIDYQKQGYLSEAIINFIAFLGWNPGTEEEIFSLEELTKRFSLDRVGKAGAIFNIERLDWINGYYIRHTDIDHLVILSLPYLEKSGLIRIIRDKNFESERGIVSLDYIKKAIGLEQERIKRLSELPELLNFLFKDKLEYDPTLLIWRKSDTNGAKKNLELLEEFISSLENTDFDKDILESKIKPWIEKNNLGVGDTLWPMRAALSGKDKSPGPFEIAEVLGKDTVLKRIREGIKKLS